MPNENNSSAPLKTAEGAYPALPEPVSKQFQGNDEGWYGFMDARHEQATMRHGEWPIRELFTAEQMRAYAAQAVEAQAAPAAVAVPEGWKLVPLQDTPKMWTAGGHAIKSCGGHDRDAASLAYKAMLEAAPTPALPATEDSSAGDLAALQPWKDHMTAQLVNQLVDVAKQFHGAQQLRERTAEVVCPLAERFKAEVQAEPVAWRWVSLNGKPAGTHCFPMPGPSNGAIRLAAAAINPCTVQYLHDHTAPQAQPADALDTARIGDRLPMQPVIVSPDTGVYRFKENRIVTKLISHSESTGYSLNEIAREFAQGMYSADEKMQLAQLIGYSVDGYGTLSYVTDESHERAAAMAAAKEGGDAANGKGGAA